MDAFQAVFKRKEIKYLLSDRQLDRLIPILSSHMEPDAFPHSSILNLYYDTPDYYMIRRSLEKPQYKEKLRLRSYGTPEDTSMVFPEIKKKARGVVYKRRVSMPYPDAVGYLKGDSSGQSSQIYQELNWMLSAYPNLAPRVFLSYERDSWAGTQDPGLRLTLDRDILWRNTGLDLRQGPWGLPLLKPNQTLMEVKVLGATPLWLCDAFSRLGIFPVSYSKYGRAYQNMCFKKFDKEFRQYA